MISRSLLVAGAIGAAPRLLAAQSASPWAVGQGPVATQPPPARTLLIRPGEVADPMAIPGVAEGAVAGEQLGPGCRGVFPVGAQQQLVVAAAIPMLDLLVRASGPTSLALRTPTGTLFCTQGAPGSEARFTLRNVQPGAYSIAVGTAPGGTLAYNLAISQRAVIVAATIALPVTSGSSVAPVAPAALPTAAQTATASAQGSAMAGWVAVGPEAPQRGPAGVAVGARDAARPTAPSGGIEVSPTGAATQRASATVIGRRSLRFVGRACLGFGDRAPSARFTVREGVSFVRVFARANADSTIAVRAPNNTVYCADDTFGVHPGVDVDAPAAGEWLVFVGTYAPRVRMPFELTVTTQRDARPE